MVGGRSTAKLIYQNICKGWSRDVEWDWRGSHGYKKRVVNGRSWVGKGIHREGGWNILVMYFQNPYLSSVRMLKAFTK